MSDVKLVDIPGKKRKKIWKLKFMNLKLTVTLKLWDLYREISYFKKGYKHRANTVKDEKTDMLTDSHSILARWRKHFSRLFDIHGVSDVRQKEIHSAEPPVPEPSAFAVEMAIGKVKSHKSPGIDQIPAELIKMEGRTTRCEIHKQLIRFGIRRNCLGIGSYRSLYRFIRRAIKQIVIIIEAYHFCQLHTKFYPTSCCQG